MAARSVIPHRWNRRCRPAGEAVAEQIAEPTADGKFKVNAKGVEELVADKGYHSADVLLAMRELGMRTYIAEPDRGRRKWAGKPEQQNAVYGNRQRIGGTRGKSKPKSGTIK